MLQHPQHFSALLGGCGSNPQQVLAALVDLMLRKFDSVGGTTAGPWRRKLWAAALCSLLGAAPDAALLARLDELMAVAADVLAELDEAAAEERGGGAAGGAGGAGGGGGAGAANPARRGANYSGFYLGELPASMSGDVGQAAASEAGRRREMMLRDWLYTCDLRAYVLGQLGACRAAVGQQAFDAAWDTVEPVIRGQVQQART